MGHLVLEPALPAASLPDFASKDQDKTGQGLIITLAAVSKKTESGSLGFGIRDCCPSWRGFSNGKFCEQTSRKHQ